MATSRLRSDGLSCNKKGNVGNETRARSLRETHDVRCITGNRGQIQRACRLLYLAHDRVTISRRMKDHAEKGMEHDDPCSLPGHRRQS